MKWLRMWLIKLTMRKVLKYADELLDYINKYEDYVFEILKAKELGVKIDELTDLLGALVKRLRKL